MIGRAYWVQTESFSDIKYTSRPFLDPTQVPPPPPPVVPVLGGESNLIGFISLTGETEVDADDYFNGVDWQVAYTYDSSAGWEVLRPDSGERVAPLSRRERLHSLRIPGRLGDAVTSPPAKH